MKVAILFRNTNYVVKENVKKVFCKVLDDELFLSYDRPVSDKFVLSEIAFYTVLS